MKVELNVHFVEVFNNWQFFFLVTKILQACDRLRDDSLPELGVKLEDVEGELKHVLSSDVH